MKIKVERSGGLAGLPISNEIDGKNLPSELVSTVKNIMGGQKSTSLSMKSTPKGAGDHYIYKISIINGVNRRVIECNQYSIQDDLKSLVKYVEKNSNRTN